LEGPFPPKEEKAMTNKTSVLMGTVLSFSLLAASSAPGQPALSPRAPEKVCLQNNRVWGFDVVDERTLQVTDLNYRRYTVHMTSGCVGLTKAVLDIALRTTTSLGCLGQGDRVSFRSPGLGRLSCTVTGVLFYWPGAPREGS